MAFDPIETGGRRLDWCLQLSEETRRVLEEEGGIDHHFMDQGIEREIRSNFDMVRYPAWNNLKSKSSQSSNSTVENEQGEPKREDKYHLAYAITGLLVVYALQNLGQGIWCLFADILTTVYGLPRLAANAISFGFLQGMMNMLGFLGGNLADGCTGRMGMVFISLGLKVLGGVFMITSAVTGDGLYNNGAAVVSESLHNNNDLSDMADTPPFASPSSFNAAVFTIIGIVLLCISGVGESSLEVLVGDQFALSPDPKQRALGTLGWDIFVVVRFTSAFCGLLLNTYLRTYPEPIWSLPYLIFPTVGILLLLLLKFTGVVRCAEPHGPQLSKVIYGIRLLMKTGGTTEGSGSESAISDLRVHCGRSVAFNTSDGTLIQSLSVEKNSKRYNNGVVDAPEDEEISLPWVMDDRQKRRKSEVLIPLPPLPKVLRNETKRHPFSRTTTLQRIQEPVDRALVNDIRQVLRMALVVAPPCVIYYGVTEFVSYSSISLVFIQLYPKSLHKDLFREFSWVQMFVVPIGIIVALTLLHVYTSRREGMGIVSLIKILIGMSIGVLCLICVVVIEVLFLSTGYRIPVLGLLGVGLLPRLGEALVMVGAVQFLFNHSPPFLRCSAMGLLLFARGLGFMLSSGLNAILGGVMRLPTQNDEDMLIIFHVVLIVCLCLSMGILYFTKRWYESHRSNH